MLLIIILILGVFIGAFVMELLNRKPNIMGHAGSRAKGVADDFRRGFSEGYRGKAYNHDDGG